MVTLERLHVGQVIGVIEQVESLLDEEVVAEERLAGGPVVELEHKVEIHAELFEDDIGAGLGGFVGRAEHLGETVDVGIVLVLEFAGPDALPQVGYGFERLVLSEVGPDRILGAGAAVEAQDLPEQSGPAIGAGVLAVEGGGPHMGAVGREVHQDPAFGPTVHTDKGVVVGQDGVPVLAHHFVFYTG